VTEKTVSFHTKDIYLRPSKNILIHARVFLDNSKRKIISYQELKRVTKTFDSNLNIKEKRQIIQNNRSKKLFQKDKSGDDSLAFFYIRRYFDYWSGVNRWN
jgi:hypothetical protein